MLLLARLYVIPVLCAFSKFASPLYITAMKPVLCSVDISAQDIQIPPSKSTSMYIAH